MLSNAYFLENVRFDTAENEPAKNLQNLQTFTKICKIANLLILRLGAEAAGTLAAALGKQRTVRLQLSVGGLGAEVDGPVLSALLRFFKPGVKPICFLHVTRIFLTFVLNLF